MAIVLTVIWLLVTLGGGWLLVRAIRRAFTDVYEIFDMDDAP